MDLSIIIVNYNVKHFLEQCLCSVRKAVGSLQAEVWVIDNQSTDHSLEYLQPLFPEVHFIANNENLGFAKACNKGLANSTGKNILFLNPDTLLSEDCLQSSIDFLQKNKEAGALGIRMLDGNGCFLKESKRAFPAPLTSLYKLSGLAALFPKSKVFARYHLGHLPEMHNHEVDVLAGAFMMIKKEVLDQVGGFDETFFMYGEDIDLSYRIQKAGYKNYYFAESSIIHFKGESTAKGSLNYVRMFYHAMSIFAHKHYGGSKAGIFSFLIQLGIWFRALMSTIGGFIRRAGLPIIDTALIIGCFWLVKTGWSAFVRPDIDYEDIKLLIAFPCFAALYLLAAYYAGLYDKWYKPSELVSSTATATLLLLAAYSLLPEQYRFSRGIILFGAILSFFVIAGLRYLLVKQKVLRDNNVDSRHSNTLIAGTVEEFNDAMRLMKDADADKRVLGRIAIDAADLFSSVGDWQHRDKLHEAVPYREMIVCEGALRFTDIIDGVRQIPPFIHIKYHAKGSKSMVGSDSKDDAGEALSKENSLPLSFPHNRRIKRLIDVVSSLGALLTFPLQFLLVKNPIQFFSNAFQVFAGNKTWIGYAKPQAGLPKLSPAILASNGLSPKTISMPEESIQLLDYWYARDYSLSQDIRLLLRYYRRLGR